MDIANVFAFGWPGVAFSCGDTYESLTLLPEESPPINKPTWEALEAIYPAYLAFHQLKATQATLANTLDEQFNSLAVAHRAAFFPLKAAVKLALELGDIEVAREIVSQTSVIETLEGVKQTMLDTIDAALFPAEGEQEEGSGQ